MRRNHSQQNFHIYERKGKGLNMNKLLAASLLALSFATGFTCSKNAPEQAAPAADTAAPTQAEMAAPAQAEVAPAAPAAPTEAAPAQPETK